MPPQAAVTRGHAGPGIGVARVEFHGAVERSDCILVAAQAVQTDAPVVQRLAEPRGDFQRLIEAANGVIEAPQNLLAPALV